MSRKEGLKQEPTRKAAIGGYGSLGGLFVAFLLASALSGQTLAITMAPWSKQAAQRVLSKRAAKTIRPWSVSIENQGETSVAISESAVLRRVPQITPYSAKAVELLISESQRNSAWARSGRAVQDLMFVALYFQSSGVVAIGRSATIGIAGAGALGPKVIDRLKGAEPPVLRNFLELAWREPVQLQPGQSATVYVFGSPEGKLETIALTIDLSKMQLVRLAQ